MRIKYFDQIYPLLLLFHIPSSLLFSQFASFKKNDVLIEVCMQSRHRYL
jgi:hypothetical protein